MTLAGEPLHVSLIATPNAQVTPLSGIFETLNAFGLLANFEPDLPKRPFTVEIVAPSEAPVIGASGLPLGAHRAYREVETTDIAIVPLMMVENADWVTGRYPGLVDWLLRMHRGGSVCARPVPVSSCSPRRACWMGARRRCTGPSPPPSARTSRMSACGSRKSW